MLVAILSTVLIGFLGLVIDGGGVAAEQQLVRAAADGAALAAAYSVFEQGSTLAGATADAGAVLVEDGLPASDLSVTYLDANGGVASTPAAVKTVKATVSSSRSTPFMTLLGIGSVTVTASAQVVNPTAAAACALCLLSASGNDLSLGNSSVTTVTGAPVIVDSTSTPNVSVGSGASLSAPAVIVAANGVQNNGTITPAPVVGSPIADPHASLAAPSLSVSPISYTAPAGTPSISPGIYSKISVGNGSALTMNPGTYVLTGNITMNGGSITATGVTIYLACSAYPTACATGASGAAFSLTGGTLTMSPPISGTFAGLSVFADRKNQANSTFSKAAVSIAGTWYTVAMAIQQTHNGDQLGFGETVARSISISASTRLTVAYVQSQSLGGTVTGPLSLSQ